MGNKPAAKKGDLAVPVSNAAATVDEVFESKSARVSCLLAALPMLPPLLVKMIHDFEYVSCVYMVGGLALTADDTNNAHLRRFDPMLNHWDKVGNGIQRHGLAAVVHRGCLFVMGGDDGARNVALVDKYDPDTGTWSQVAPMKSGRLTPCAVALGGHIYVLGGFDGMARLKTMERYDPGKNEWVTLPPMLDSEGPSLAATVVGQCIFVLGGGKFSGVEKFDVTTQEWSIVSPMSKKRYGLSAASLGGFVYALGGEDENFTLSECEKYDPSTDTWVNIAPMTHARHAMTVTVLGNRLIVLGGLQHSSIVLNTAESYDPVSDTWTLLVPLPSANARHAAVCL